MRWFHNPLLKPAAPTHAVGAIVQFTDPGTCGKLGKVEEVFQHHRHGCSAYGPPPEHLLYHVRYYDLHGFPMTCPDARCTGQHTCPIHGANLRAEQIQPLSERDLAYYREHGLIKD